MDSQMFIVKQGVNTMIPYNRKLVYNAKWLRKNMTKEEKHLWYDFLKKIPFTVKRQHNIENYIVDFYIPEKKIVIEIDGIQHTAPKNAQKDEIRDEALAFWGITVLRYSNKDINTNFYSVINDIMEKLKITVDDLME